MCSGSAPTQVAEVRIRCYRNVLECEVVVAVRGKEIILRCPDYDQAAKYYGRAPSPDPGPAR